MAVPFLRDDPLPHGAVEETAPGIRRVVCNNPSAFTFRGTNTYIIGRGKVAVMDPGPVDDAHLAAILAATQGEMVTHVIVTHTHRDHSPGHGGAGRGDGGEDLWLRPAHDAARGRRRGWRPQLPSGRDRARQRHREGEDWRLTALHTPGHCANHLCFAMEGNGVLFSADHVMSWSTSVVSPPDGDHDGLHGSLQRLIARDDRILLPGHGPAIRDPKPFLAGLAAHREEREARVLVALTAGTATAVELVGAGLRATRPAAGEAGGAQPAEPPDQA